MASLQRLQPYPGSGSTSVTEATVPSSGFERTSRRTWLNQSTELPISLAVAPHGAAEPIAKLVGVPTQPGDQRQAS